MFDDYLLRWDLSQDGEPVTTRSSKLLPVRCRGEAAMLKIAVDAEERAGGALTAWWAGEGAAAVLAHDAEAVLLERAQGASCLSAMARAGRDEKASRIICGVVAKLHAPRPAPRPELRPLRIWFRELGTAALSQGGIFAVAMTELNGLLANPREVGVLHGDIHHDNVLDFGAKGWLAIDPKGLVGERGYDYANLFRNPGGDIALQPGRFERQVELVAACASLERTRLLQWVLSVMGLSAAWHLGDSERPGTTLAIAAMAAAALGRTPL